MKKIVHEGEVLKCRQNPLNADTIASILTTGVVNLYSSVSGQKAGSLAGLTEESFCLDWNKKRSGLLASAASHTVCVWDADHHVTSDPASGSCLLKIEVAHGSAEQPVNDVKFSPHNDW